MLPPKVESSTTSLASRTHFEVLGLGLEASSPRKLPCPRLEDRLFFEWLKFCRSAKNFISSPFFFFGDRLKQIFEDLFFRRSPGKNFEAVFFWRARAFVSLVLGLGLEHSCPWPRECLSSEGLSLALALNFFVFLALASSLVSSTPPLVTPDYNAI